ncbi:MAG: HTH-type transcriptional repressor YvoA [Firmicutes bacterium ADurb.Bin182]|nr:MAG: HTH-type transcriptional repressor YvoA [Firmicutes bacterium ADurb.Bin182]
MIDKSSGIPVYKQIEMAIRTDIDRGIYSVGVKLPSEDVLAERMGASRGTVRQALSELASQGIVKRIHGNGTFVCEPGNEYKIENDHFISFLDGLESSGVPVDTFVLDRKVVGASSISSDIFPGVTQLYEIRRIRKRNGKAIMMSYDYIPTDLVPGIENRYQNEKSVYDFLEAYYSIRVSKVKRIFQAVAAVGDIAKLLTVKTGEPLFYIVQQAFDEYSRCVDHANLYIVSEGMHFSIISSR